MDKQFVATELMAIASEVAAAEKLLVAEQYVTAEEMAQYCQDCAAKIRSGAMKITRQEMDKVIAGLKKPA